MEIMVIEDKVTLDKLSMIFWSGLGIVLLIYLAFKFRGEGNLLFAITFCFLCTGIIYGKYKNGK